MVELIESRIFEVSKLTEIVRREVARYAATSDDALFFPIFDEEKQAYAVVVIERQQELRPSWVLVMARIADDKIIIEEDATLEKHLVDALRVNAGVPRSQIILAYSGEPTP
jgi:hypothetical protein